MRHVLLAFLLAFVLVGCPAATTTEAPDSSLDASGPTDTSLADASDATSGSAPDAATDAAPDASDDAGASTGRPPNILVVIADDFGVEAAVFDAAAPCYDLGDASIAPRMPNLARLCASGLRFDRAWAYPTCSPTRATILTGKYPVRHGVGSALLGQNGLDFAEVTLPELLALAPVPYATGNVGKWHVSLGDTDPLTQGYDMYRGNIRGALPDYYRWDRVANGVAATSTTYATTAAVDDAISWLDGLDHDAPWFLWVAFNAPHTPLHDAPAALHDVELGPTSTTHDQFSAMSQALDTELGRLLDHLDASGSREDTFVVFIGDNGTARNVIQLPYTRDQAKSSLYEGGVRVPFVVQGPGVRVGAEPALVGVVDLFATLLELAGAPPEIPHDSVSFAPYLRGDASPSPRDYITSEQFLSGTAAPTAGATYGMTVRDDAYKYICKVNEGGSFTEELYLLTEQPWERDDLLLGDLTPEAQGSLDALRAHMADLRADAGADALCAP